MTQSIAIFDSNDGSGAIENIAARYSETASFFKSQAEIIRTLSSIAKQPLISVRSTSKNDFSYLLIHQGDIQDLPDYVSVWIQSNRTKIVIYSGGAAGENGVFHRSEVQKKLEDFILRVKNDEPNAIQAFTVQPLRSIMQWLSVYHHEFGNLYAPLDFLALMYQGGDISSERYQELKQALQLRISSSLNDKKHSNPKWDAFLKKGETSFIDIKHVEFEPGHFVSINRLISYPVIHIDDEIENGWDLVFPEVFGDQYIRASTPEQGLIEIEKYANSSCLVLLDLRMPNAKGNLPDRETGLAALRSIRRKWPSLPVYVFSANTDYESYGMAMDNGATGYIVKYARSLESRIDRDLYVELWNAMRSSRIANIKHCICNAFSSIEQHKKFKTLPKRNRTKGALLEISKAFQSVPLDRMVLEDDQAISNARYLLIIMYKTIEHLVQKPNRILSKGRPIQINDSWILVPKQFRNRSAHNERIELEESRIWPGIREVLLSASILITKWGEILKDSSWARNWLEQLNGLVMIDDLSQREIGARRHDGNILHSKEECVSAVIKFYDTSAGTAKHRLIQALAIDCIDSQSLGDQSYFRWLRADDLCPINYTNTQLENSEPGNSAGRPSQEQKNTSVINPPSSLSARRTFRKKSLNDLFDIKNGTFFHRMNKFYGQSVDLSVKSQFDYLQWYFNDHILKYPDSYEENVLSTFQTWMSKALNPVGATQATISVKESKLEACFLDISLVSDDDPRDKICTSAQANDPMWVPRINKMGADSLYRVETLQNEKIAILKGVRMGTPSTFVDMRVISVSPSILHFTEPTRPIGREWVYNGEKIWKFRPKIDDETSTLKVLAKGSHPLTMQDASRAFDVALRLAKQCISSVSGPVSWDKLGAPDRFSDTILVDYTAKDFTLKQVNSIMGNALDGVKLAVINATGQADETIRLKQSIDASVGRPNWIEEHEIENSDGFITIVESDLTLEQINILISSLDAYKKPYLVINPGNYKYKTYGIAAGLRARLSTPLWSLSGRKPSRLYFGLDIGTRSKENSILAVSCIDHTGRLRAWCRVSNPGHSSGPERINLNAFQEAISLLLDKLSLEVDLNVNEYELVIHRDGNTLEDAEEFISVLRDAGFANSIEWVDVIKHGAPIILSEALKQSGLYLHINNASGTEKCWNMQSSQDGEKYIRPLIVEQQVGSSPLQVLASEVFHLGQVATHHYLGQQKLPATTYYADGFSKSGSEFLSFAGYEHLRATPPKA